MSTDHTPDRSTAPRPRQGSCVRIFVHKPARAGWTTVSLPPTQYAALLKLAKGDRTLVAIAAREASWKARDDGKNLWSHQVVAGAFRILKRLHAQLPDCVQPSPSVVEPTADEVAWTREHNARIEAEYDQ